MAALAACTDGGTDAEDDASDGGGSAGAGGGPDAPTSAPPDPSAAVLSTSLHHGSAEVTVEVRPVVRHQEFLVLTLDLSADDPDASISGDLLSEVEYLWGSDEGPFHGIRLLDLTGDLVAVPARDSHRAVTRSTGYDHHDGEVELEGSLQIVFGDLGTETVALFLPKSPLVTAVPVIDAEPPPLDADSDPVDLSAVEQSPLVPMVSLSADLIDPIHQQEDRESTTVDIGSDILFDSSSATLSEKAAGILDDAVARVLQHEPGTVTVIGHTDSVDDEEFNLDLSQRRAEAVAEVLTSLLDTEEFPLETEGKGESSPVADNGTEEGRTRNRRVELQISTPRKEDAQQAEVSAAADFDGITATGDEGLLLEEFDVRPVHLRALSARIISEHLVVSLEAVIADEEVDSTAGLGGYNHLLMADSGIHRAHTHCGIAVLTGSVMTMPAFHRLTEEGDLISLTDTYTPDRIDGGVPRVLGLIYPRDIPGVAPGGMLTLQHGRNGFRLTDIPIED